MSKLARVRLRDDPELISAYREIRAVREQHPAIPDLRTAAFLVAIEKVGRSYMELGIFP